MDGCLLLFYYFNGKLDSAALTLKAKCQSFKNQLHSQPQPPNTPPNLSKDKQIFTPCQSTAFWKINSHSVVSQNQKIEAPYNHICDLGASVECERAHKRTFNMPRLKSQIWLQGASIFVCLATQMSIYLSLLYVSIFYEVGTIKMFALIHESQPLTPYHVPQIPGGLPCCLSWSLSAVHHNPGAGQLIHCQQ